jgi:hypothetical protein
MGGLGGKGGETVTAHQALTDRLTCIHTFSSSWLAAAQYCLAFCCNINSDNQRPAGALTWITDLNI